MPWHSEKQKHWRQKKMLLPVEGLASQLDTKICHLNHYRTRRKLKNGLHINQYGHNVLTVHKLCCKTNRMYFLCSSVGICVLQLSNVPLWNLALLIFAELYSWQRMQCVLEERLLFCCLLHIPHLSIPCLNHTLHSQNQLKGREPP